MGTSETRDLMAHLVDFERVAKHVLADGRRLDFA